MGVSLPTGGQISLTYDAASNGISIKDPDGNVTTYHYDVLNRVDRVTDPGNRLTTYSYDNAGNLQSLIDRDNRQRTFGYDTAGRLTTEKWVTAGNPTFSYTYDAASQMISAQDPNSVYTYGYDARGRLLSADNVNSPNGFPHLVLTYTYDPANNRLTLSDSLNGGVTYAYDADNRLTGAWLFATGSTAVPQITLGYDLEAQVRVIGRQIAAGPGVAQVTSAYDYTARNQVKSIQHTSSVAGALANYSYGYDAAQRLTSYTGPEGTVNLAYDTSVQLTGASGARTESYGYDNNGNRNTTGYQTDAGNRLRTDGNYTYTYDGEGNLIGKSQIGGNLVTTYTWDFRNRLTEVLIMNGTTTVADDKFTYDVLDRRIGKSTLGGGQTWTVYDGANPYADFNGGTLAYRYLYGNAVDALFARFDGTSGNNSTAWYLAENLGSVRQMVKTDGTAIATITYDSFGNIIGSVTGDRFKFTGREYDSEIGLYYYRERYYDPAVGRFLSEDPIGFTAGDTNLYRYVNNEPTNSTDPTGLWRRRWPRPWPPLPPPPPLPLDGLPCRPYADDGGDGGRISYYGPPTDPLHGKISYWIRVPNWIRRGRRWFPAYFLIGADGNIIGGPYQFNIGGGWGAQPGSGGPPPGGPTPDLYPSLFK